MSVHEEKIFECNMCESKFSLERGLKKTHFTIHIHDQVKPFKCEVCDKTFVLNQNFSVHMKRKCYQQETENNINLYSTILVTFSKLT